jgi:putative component of membrane protein insertase Oxa1/YidC/SpoIIIJ protein YidD
MIRLLPLLGILIASPALAAPWGPWDQPVAAPASQPEAPSGMSLAFMGLIRGYQLVLSNQDAAACPMYPSCSRFSMEAFARFGPLQGLLMTTDRFIRENEEAHSHYPIIPIGDRLLSLDPPTERNLW